MEESPRFVVDLYRRLTLRVNGRFVGHQPPGAAIRRWRSYSGNGFGAVVVRQLTVYGVGKIRKYVYLKNNAMYSVLVLGGSCSPTGWALIPPSGWVSPVATFVIVGYFLLLSRLRIRKGR